MVFKGVILGMSLFKTRMSQLKDYMKIQRQEQTLTNKLVTRYREKGKKAEEYNEFKKSIMYQIDKLFNQRKSKIVIVPRENKIGFYEQLLEDDDFTRYYKCEVKAGNQMEITMVEL